MGEFLAYFLYLFPNRLKSTTFVNLQLCFNKKSKKEISELTRLSLSETSKSFFESGKNWITYPKKGVNSIVEVEGLNELKKSVDKNQGVILFTPHLGNIEVIINYLSNNFSCAIPYTEVKITSAENLIKKARLSMGASMINTSTSGVRTLLGSLNKGDVVAIA